MVPYLTAALLLLILSPPVSISSQTQTLRRILYKSTGVYDWLAVKLSSDWRLILNLFMANFLQIHISATFCLQELPTVHSGEALNMWLVEGEPWSWDEDAHNKAAINGGCKENDMLYKKTVDTQAPVKWLLLPEVLKRIVNPLTCLFQGVGPKWNIPKSFKH